MGDAVGECFGVLCSCCCICASEGIQQWCFFNRWGSGSSTSNAGCCTSCCKRSFDDDDFEREERKLGQSERRVKPGNEIQLETVPHPHPKAPANGDHVVSTQPTGAKMMSDRPRSSQESTRRDDALVKDET
ncbi:hypothetical protein BC629DRAFT_1509690 [Irpex lacteus]|nr:hypothetical protein BC629DRAFT_1509690 [Irpex lacteus]